MKKKWEQENGFYKVGIRLLSPVQLENIFPNYRDLLDRIEDYREKAEERREEAADHDQYNLMYDNVFSIFGKRGTGKTSVAFTLQSMIERTREDLVLPIIIPEVIPDECSALVWLFAIIREKVEELERENCMERRGKKDEGWEICHYRERDTRPLTNRLDALQELLFAGKYNPSGEPSYYRAVENSAKQVVSSYRFSHEVARFWDALVEELKKRGKNGEGEAKRSPLIFFIFDDVDLEPQKVTELLSIIIKYLSHPNLIVLTTADEELFLEVIENNLDRAIGRLPKEWRAYLRSTKGQQWRFWDEEEPREREGDLIAQTSRMYLGKVLPTSTRYYLRLFESAWQKRQFRLDDREFLGDSMCRLVEWLEEKEEGEDTFLRRGGKTLLFYINFMGDTSRQIGNAYLEFKTFLRSMARETELAQSAEWDREHGLNRIYQQCRYFLYTEISANHDLAAEIDNLDRFVNGIFQMDFNQWRFYVNYNYLNDFLEELRREKYDGKPDKLITPVLQLYALSMLLENVLLILEKRIPDGITGRKRVHGIARMCSFITNHIFAGQSLFRTDLDADSFFLHYNQLFDKLGMMGGNDDNPGRFYQGYLYAFLDAPYEKKELHYYGLRRMMEGSRDWLNTMAGQIAMVYGGMYLVDEQDVETCVIFGEEDCVAAYQETIREEQEKHFRGLFEPLELYEEAGNFLNRLKADSGRYLKREEHSFGKFIDRLEREVTQQENARSGDADSQAHRYLLMGDLIREVLRRGGDCPLETFLSLYADAAEEEEERLVGVLRGEEPVDGLMRTLVNGCQEWDFEPHRLALFEGSEWLDRLRSLQTPLEAGNWQRQALCEKLERIMGKQTVQEEETWTVFKDAALYRTIREYLESLWEKTSRMPVEEERRTKEEVSGLLSNMDIIIDLNQKEELRAAVQIGVIAGLMQQLQKIYICQTVRRKYDRGHSRSAQGMRRKRSGDGQQETADRAYYYEMFVSMKEILEGTAGWKDWILEEYPDGTAAFVRQEERRIKKEMSALRNFLRRSVELQKGKYIRALLGRDRDE